MLLMFTGGCPEGHYCPQNTTDPIGCAAGTYQDLTHQSSCKTCVQGYYCLANSTTYLSTPCLTGKGDNLVLVRFFGMLEALSF